MIDNTALKLFIMEGFRTVGRIDAQTMILFNNAIREGQSGQAADYVEPAIMPANLPAPEVHRHLVIKQP